MSLDVYLIQQGVQGERREAIFIFEGGRNMELSHEEWDQRFPNRKPVYTTIEGDAVEVFEANITHNLSHMASEAGIYEHLWRPDELGVKTASVLIEPLREGLWRLKAKPDHFRTFDASNGWGTYEQFVPWVEKYLEACKRNPDAEVRVWR